MIDWWPIYEEIKLREKEELRGQRPLYTGETKLSEVRWLKAMCYGEAYWSCNKVLLAISTKP
jgi:hypothetical protein